MWALIYSITVIGTTSPVVYNIATYPTYVECFQHQRVYLLEIKQNESLNCVSVKIKK